MQIPFVSIHKLTLESDPDKYTIVPAPLKILKVLVVELQSASGAPLDAQAAAELAEEDSGDEVGQPKVDVNLVPGETTTGTASTTETTGDVNYPVQMAAVALVSLPLFLVFVFLRKYIMSGVSRSGIKG